MAIIRDYKIGRHLWTVGFAPQKSNLLEGNLGIIYYHTKEIYVSQNQTEIEQEESFSHELVHALLQESGYNEKIEDALGDYYENFVDALGDKLLDVLYQIEKKEKRIDDRGNT